MDVLPRLKLLNDLTAGTPPAVTLVRSFPANGMYLHEPVQDLNLIRRSIARLEPVMPVTRGISLLPTTYKILSNILL
jgi:hypothetical protein